MPATPIPEAAAQVLEPMLPTVARGVSQSAGEARESPRGAPVAEARGVADDPVLPQPTAESESPHRVVLLGQFVGTDLPGWALWETLVWEAQWEDPGVVTHTDLHRFDFSGSWSARVRPGRVSIVCDFVVGNFNELHTILQKKYRAA
jgi:hypothetical protein